MGHGDGLKRLWGPSSKEASGAPIKFKEKEKEKIEGPTCGGNDTNGNALTYISFESFYLYGFKTCCNFKKKRKALKRVVLFKKKM